MTRSLAKRRMLLVLMSQVWDKQIPIIEQEIMKQLGLEYCTWKANYVKAKKVRLRFIRHEAGHGVIAHLINRYNQTKQVCGTATVRVFVASFSFFG